jgi:hypothetical protein
MIKLIVLPCVLMGALWVVPAHSGEIRSSAANHSAAPETNKIPDSQQIEKDLQQLSWKQFRSIVESIPKLKADIEAYGPIGWQFVQTNYKTHGWKKNIDKLDGSQKRQLVDMIQTAKRSR